MEKQTGIYFVKLVYFHENNATLIQTERQESVLLLGGEFIALTVIFCGPFVFFFNLVLPLNIIVGWNRLTKRYRGNSLSQVDVVVVFYLVGVYHSFKDRGALYAVVSV